MKLKETVWKICEGVKSDFSAETLTALVLYKIVQNPVFKDNNQHIAIIERKGEKRLFSLPLNDVHGLTNRNLNSQMISSRIDHEDSNFFDKPEIVEPEDDEYYYYDEPTIDWSDVKLHVPDERFNNIQKFASILRNANTFNDFIKELEKNKKSLFDLSQIVMDNGTFNREYGMKGLFKIANNSMKYDIKEGFFKESNKTIEPIDFFIARDELNASVIHSFIHAKNFDMIKERLDNSSLWTMSSVFKDDKTGKIPEEIENILKDENQENSNVFEVYENSDIEMPILLKTSISCKPNVSFDVIELFYDELKNNFLNSFDKLDFLRPNSELDKAEVLVNRIVERVEKYYPSLTGNANKTIEVVYFSPDNSDDYGVDYMSRETIFDKLSNLNKFGIQDSDNVNNATQGLSYLQSDDFSYASQRDNFSICLKNEDELIGFGHFFIESGQIRINTVNISSHYRGNGHITEIYEKLCDIAVEKNLPIQTSMYSNDGNKYLPKVKQKLFEHRKDVLWLDTCRNPLGDQADDLFENINDHLLNVITKKYAETPMTVWREAVDEKKQELRETYGDKELEFFEKIEIRNKLVEDVENKAKEKFNIKPEVKRSKKYKNNL